MHPCSGRTVECSCRGVDDVGVVGVAISDGGGGCCTRSDAWVEISSRLAGLRTQCKSLALQACHVGPNLHELLPSHMSKERGAIGIDGQAGRAARLVVRGPSGEVARDDV